MGDASTSRETNRRISAEAVFGDLALWDVGDARNAVAERAEPSVRVPVIAGADAQSDCGLHCLGCRDCHYETDAGDETVVRGVVGPGQLVRGDLLDGAAGHCN